ncbi:MAG TPA: hypothetical protein VFG73_02500 [Rhodanobacteraceae bacterium]|nr:hypothetical protein [Rhodanobacteraceae bacterium]
MTETASVADKLADALRGWLALDKTFNSPDRIVQAIADEGGYAAPMARAVLAAGEALKAYDLAKPGAEKERQTIALAFGLADSAARADIECATRLGVKVGGVGWLSVAASDLDPEDVETVQTALAYLDLRCRALPYEYLREGDRVRFQAWPRGQLATTKEPA